MAVMESLKIKLGTRMPDFALKDPKGQSYAGESLYGKKGLLVVFTCNHCPYAQAVWPRLIRLSSEAKKLGIPTVAINPNIHPDYPDDSPERMIEKIKELMILFPYLIDETQQVAKAFGAQCTPDIYLYNARRELVYHGRIDDNWKEEAKVKRHELKEAITQLSLGAPVSEEQHPSMGCSIKWRE